MAQTRGYIGSQRPALEDLDRCTRCGLCEQACPTYRLLQFEPDSPRGRIFMMKQVAEGLADIDEHLAEHLYRCLGCRACETVCPAGVPFGRLLEYGRHQIELRGEISPTRRAWRSFRSLAFERVLASPWLFRAAMLPARTLQALPPVLCTIQSLPLPRKLAQLVRMIPRKGASKLAPPHTGANKFAPLHLGRIISAQGERRARVGLFVGCVMGSLFSDVHAATIRVLMRNGCEVVVAAGQWCCGALNVHAGERDVAACMAARNIAAFAREKVDAVIVNSAGCGAVMKEYAELFKGNSTAADASDFAAKVKDVHEFLAELGLRPGLRPLRLRVTYQDACHLAHGQRIREQPRTLLKQIPGIEYVELAHADQCCGAAGVYSLTQPDLSAQILAHKIDEIAQTRAQVVTTANPGCTMQLQAGLLERKLDVRVCHVMELLDQSYSAPM